MFRSVGVQVGDRTPCRVRMTTNRSFGATGVVSDVTGNAAAATRKTVARPNSLVRSLILFSRPNCHRAPEGSPDQIRQWAGVAPVQYFFSQLKLEAKHELNLPRQTGAGVWG